MVFVSVGTERFPFDRLIQAVDQAASQLNGEPIFVQLGHSTYRPQRCQWTRILPYQDLIEQIRRARIVVCHAGAGILLLCARSGKAPIVLPRRKRFGEHVDDHQPELAMRMAQLGYVLLAERPEEIVPLILEYEEREARMCPRFPSHPALASSLSEYLATTMPRALADDV